MDNQQERLLSLDFVAGLMVGEGCFTISIRRGKGDRFHFSPTFAMSMNDQETMLQVLDTLRAHDLPVYVNARNNRKSIEFRVTGYKRVKKYVDLFVPLLTGDKKKSAELVQRFVDSRLAKYPKAPPSEDELDTLAELREHLGYKNHLISNRILRDYTPNFNKRSA